ncbi:MAG: SDR family NAD(P)-dependent oxidoreductase, partial [Chthoniobacterales bacterium]
MKKIFLSGASSGIGLAIAERLCAEGHEVWGTSRDPQRIPKLVRLHAVHLDLADTSAAVLSFSNALGEAGAFDVVINNAGSGHFGPAQSVSPDLLREQFQTLVFAQIALTRAALAAMQKRGSGLIINVTSLASRLPVPFMSAYNAAKAAMASFTMTLQLELRGSGIRIIDLQPGDIRTHFNDVVTKNAAADPGLNAAAEQAWRVVDRNIREAPE